MTITNEKRYAVKPKGHPDKYWNKRTGQWDAAAAFSVLDHATEREAFAAGQMAEDASGRALWYSDGTPVPGTGGECIPVRVVQLQVRVAER